MGPRPVTSASGARPGGGAPAVSDDGTGTRRTSPAPSGRAAPSLSRRRGLPGAGPPAATRPWLAWAAGSARRRENVRARVSRHSACAVACSVVRHGPPAEDARPSVPDRCVIMTRCDPDPAGSDRWDMRVQAKQHCVRDKRVFTRAKQKKKTFTTGQDKATVIRNSKNKISVSRDTSSSGNSSVLTILATVRCIHHARSHAQ